MNVKKVIKKNKWINVIKVLLFLIFLLIVVTDLFTLIFIPFFTSELPTWSIFGFITFLFSYTAIGIIVEDFQEQFKENTNNSYRYIKNKKIYDQELER